MPRATSPEPTTDLRLRDDGYAVARSVLSTDLMKSLQSLAERRLAAEGRDHFESFRFHGSMLSLDPFAEDPVRTLVALPAVRQVLREFGFDSPKWLSAYLISKPPGSPSLWWHQDWWAWHNSVSFAPWPPQLFVMYYLRDVAAVDGALRVIPGSHRSRHSLHGALPPAHSSEINEAPEAGPAHARQPEEVTVEVKAGDAVIGDARLLHSTHPNRSHAPRTCLTLWYLPCFEQLPEQIRSYVVDHPALPPRGWWENESPEVPAALQDLLPTYDGAASAAVYNRTPPEVWPRLGSAATKRQ